MIITGIFFILHGLIHLLYAGQSWRLFELRPEMTWPDGSWAFSRLFGDEPTRVLGTIILVIITIGYLISGIGLFANQSWWRSMVAGSAVLSSVLFILLWNGKFQALDDQGGVGILINMIILLVVMVFKWPA